MRAFSSACLRSRIAFRASPGLETLDRSNRGLVSAAGLLADVPRLPPLKYPRTRSAWSASIELECVLPVTPSASSASRIGLLFTSSSRAKSLIRTLLIRPFSVAPCAVSWSYQLSLNSEGMSIVSLLSGDGTIPSPVILKCVAGGASHGRARPYLVPRPRSPGSGPPVHRPRRCPSRSVLRGRPHR